MNNHFKIKFQRLIIRHYQKPIYTQHTQIARHLAKIAFRIKVLDAMPGAGANSGIENGL
jgi:hypothetical protein